MGGDYTTSEASLTMSQAHLDDVVAQLSSEECIVTLAKVLDNILHESIYDKKTRKLKLSNETFSRRVARHSGGVDFLLACQFTQKGQVLQLLQESENKMWLWKARRALHARAEELSIGIPSMPPVPDAENSKSVEHDAREDLSILDHSTIATMDELEFEILKELEEGQGSLRGSTSSRLDDQIAYFEPISPLGTSEFSVTQDLDRSLDTPGLGSGNSTHLNIDGTNKTYLDSRDEGGRDAMAPLASQAPSNSSSNDEMEEDLMREMEQALTEDYPSHVVSRAVGAVHSPEGGGTMAGTEPPKQAKNPCLDIFDGLQPPSATEKAPHPMNGGLSTEFDIQQETEQVQDEQIQHVKFPLMDTSITHENRTTAEFDNFYLEVLDLQPSCDLQLVAAPSESEQNDQLKSMDKKADAKTAVELFDTPDPINSSQSGHPISEDPDHQGGSAIQQIDLDPVFCLSSIHSESSRSSDFEKEMAALLQEMHSNKASPDIQFNALSFDEDMTEDVSDDKTTRMEKNLSDSKRQDAEIFVVAGIPPTVDSQESVKDFFDGSERQEIKRTYSDDDLPMRMRTTPSPPSDDLEKEMSSLLALGSAIDHSQVGDISKTEEEFEDNDSIQSNHHSIEERISQNSQTKKSIPEQIPSARAIEMEKSAPADMQYSSINAHSDLAKLQQLMKDSSLASEFEACWGSLCTLSVVCADLPIEELGLSPPASSKTGKVRHHRSKRSWLPLELVQGLWRLVLSSQDRIDAARTSYVCSKVYDILVESRYLDAFERGEGEQALPHNTWVRVKKEKMVLLGYALPISVSRQSDWMGKLATAIMDDTQFWYGRFALPTIAIAGINGGDDELKAKSLLRDIDFIQSRLDVIGVVTGTRRHISDCKSFAKAKKQMLKDKQFTTDVVRVTTYEDIGYDAALDGCQQVATCLYRYGQVLTKSGAPTVQMIELATALQLIGNAVGGWGDWEMEMQLYQKTLKILQDCSGYNTECAGDTLISMGACRLGQGDLGGAMGCYEEAHDIYSNRLGEKSDRVALALHHMGVIHCEKKELETAMEAFKTSLKIKQDNGMQESYDEATADTLCWIGKVYREQGLLDKAKKYFDNARDVKEDLCGADSLEVAEILHNIAVLYDDSGDFEKSLRYYRRSLKIRRAILGDQHEDVCELMTCIGNVYKSMGDEDTALKAFRRASELRSLVARGAELTKPQTKALIRSYEDILEILRVKHKSSKSREIEQDEIASILLKMGQLYDTIKNFSRCDRCFDKALKLRLTAGENAKAGQVLNVKGISYAKRQKYTDAMSAFEKALELRKSALGEHHIDVAETLHNMGNCAAKSGDLSDARAQYDEALRIKRKNLGNENSSVAQTLHNIGNVLVRQGCNDKAMNCYQEALSLRIAVLGDDNIEVAYSLHCIAKINRMQHDIDAARENFNTALRIKRLKLPKNHPSIAETLEQLGSLYVEIGEDDEAALCLNGALNIYKAKHGEGIKVAEVYEQLGDKYEREQSFGKALMYYHKALRVRVKVFGEDHVSVADAYYHVGRLQRDQQSDHEALSSFQAATKIRKKTVGRNDVIISDILKDAGQLQMKLGQVEIANKCFGESLRIRSAILDPRHMKIGECHVLHSDVLIAQGKYVEAIANLQEALEIFQDNEGDCGDSCLQVYQRLAQACKESSEFDKAQEYYEKCLKCRRQRQEESNSIAIAKINHGLGQVFYAMGDYRRAEEFFRDCVEAMVAELGEDHLEVANAVLSLGMTCTKLNSPDEANMYFEQARLTKQQHLGDGNLEVAEIGLEIGRANVVKKEYEEALQCFQSYLRIRRVAVGDDVLVCNVLHEIGCAEHSLGRHDAALKSLASALALYRVLLGDEDVAVADTLYTLGVVYEAKHEFRESIKYHKEAFRLRRQLLGADDLAVADSLDKISSLYLRQPNLEKALQSMKEVLRIRTLHLGKDHIDVGTSLFGMGVIFAEVGDMEKAMDCYKVSLKIRKENLGDASVEVAQTFHNMGTVLGRQQDYPSALKHWRKALNSYREAGLSDENHLVAITIGNINMAEAYLHDVNEDNKQA